MKKIIRIVLLVLFGLCLAYVGFNRIDAKADPGMFSARDLPAADFGYDNGFYRLWTLGLDDAIDVEAPAVKERYRRLFDRQFDNDKLLRAFDAEKHKKETSITQRLGKIFPLAVNKINEIGNAPPVSLEKQMLNKEAFVRFRREQPLLMQRYEKFLGSGFFQDFSLPRADCPIPNLVTWLRLAKLHIGLSLVDATDGQWAEAAAALIRQVEFAKKAVAGSRLLITNLVAKAVLNLSAQGLAFLMNQKDCPADVFAQVLAALPPIRYEEYGSRNGFIGEFLFTRSGLGHFDAANRKAFDLDRIGGFLAPLGLQKNRTLNAYHDYIRSALELESTPQQGNPLQTIEPRKHRSGSFWWLQNPAGKILLDRMIPNMGTVVFKALRTRSIYDMTRISAELHLRYDPARSVQENLSALATYQTLDPCSGKPYIWNEDKQVLYSVGVDRVDGGGVYDATTVRTDVVLPVILYLRPGQ